MLQLIGFDGDDTLWHSEGYYREAGEVFAAILGRYVDLGDQHAHDSMLATEQRNLQLFGYGAKGMALSMVETAIEISDGRITAADIHQLVELGKTRAAASGGIAARHPRSGRGGGRSSTRWC